MNKVEYIPGDLIMYNGKVCYISYWERSGVYGCQTVGGDITTFRFVKRNELKPIPITMQFLKKNGWKDDGTDYDYQLNGKLYLIAEYKDKKHKIIESVEVYNNLSPDSYDVGQDDFYLKTISNVHELQHLLFGLGLDSNMIV